MELGFRWFLGAVFQISALMMTLFFSANAQAYEVKRDSEGNLIRWQSDEIELCLGVELLEVFGVEQALHAAEGAAAAWSGIPNVPEIQVSVSNTRAFDPARVSNCIHWTRPWVGTQRELALTYTASDGEGYVRAADIVLNGRHRFGRAGTVWGGRFFDLQAVLTHEMGHLLGLAENTEDDLSTMDPDIGPNETFQREITDDDRAGVEFVYSSPQYEPAASCNMGQGHRNAPTGALVVLLVFGVRVGRRRFVHFGRR